MNASTLRLPVLLAALAGALTASAQNLVQNASFEAPFTIAPFVATGQVSLSSAVFTPNANTLASDGTQFALFGFQGGVGSLRQTLATQVGHQYEVSFDLSVLSANPNNAPAIDSFIASFAGQDLLNLLFPTPSPIVGGLTTYTRYSFVVNETIANDSLRFVAGSDGNGFFALDNLSVTDLTPSAVPGPLAALPFGLLALRRRRKD